MKYYGNVELSNLGDSKVLNAVLEHAAGAVGGGSLPTGSAGRLVYNTDDSLYYFYNGSSWIEIGAGGDVANIQSELNTTQTTLGDMVNADGTANTTNMNALDNVTGASTISDVLADLDAAISGLSAFQIIDADDNTYVRTEESAANDDNRVDIALGVDGTTWGASAGSDTVATFGTGITRSTIITGLSAASGADIEGSTIQLQGGAGDTGGLGGEIQLLGGVGGDDAAGGAVTIIAGASGATSNASHDGGDVAITAGATASDLGYGGDISITAGASTHATSGNDGGDIGITGGTSTYNNGGSVTVAGGDSPVDGNDGGDVTIAGGSSGSYSGGDIVLLVGDGSGSSNGSVSIFAPDASNTAEVRFYDGSNYTSLRASASLTSNAAFILPLVDGSTANDVMVTDASGQLSFKSLSTVVDGDYLLTVGGDLTGNLTMTNGGVIENVNGTDSAPSYSFDGDPDTGLYIAGTNNMSVSAGGSRVAAFTTAGLLVDDEVTAGAGLTSSPSFSFYSDANTGMYNPSADSLGFSVGSSLAFTIESNGTLSVVGTTNYETLVTSDDDIPNKKFVDDAITTANNAQELDGLTDVDDDTGHTLGTGYLFVGDGTNLDVTEATLDTLNDVTITSGANNEFLVFTGSVWEDTTKEDAQTAMDVYNKATTDGAYLQVDGGNSMAAVLNMGGSNKITSLSDPTNAQDAATKSYVDALTAGLVWLDPCYYIDLVRDDVGDTDATDPLIRDLQTPANDTNELVGAENSDMYIIGNSAPATLTLRAVGTTGTTSDSVDVNPGEIWRFDADVDNDGLTPAWEFIDHIKNMPQEATGGSHIANARWGLNVDTAVATAGTFVGLDRNIVELVKGDVDGDDLATEYDALWGIRGGQGGVNEVSSVDTVADSSDSLDGTYFTINAAIGRGSSTWDTQYYVWFDNTGSTVDPNPGSIGTEFGIKVLLTTNDTANDVATAIKTAVDLFYSGALWTVAISTNELTFTDTHLGNVTIPGAGTSTFTVATDTAGVTPTEPVNNTAFFVSNPDSNSFGNQYVYNATDDSWSLFGGQATAQAGVGLSYSGTTLNVNLGAGVKELPSDEVGVDLRTDSGLFTTVDGSAVSTLTGAQLSIKLDGSTLTRASAGLKISTGGVSGVELHASVAGSGLTGAGGSPLAVNVDNSTLEIDTDVVQVADGGVTNAKLANSSFTVTDGSTPQTIDLGDTLEVKVTASTGLSINTTTDDTITIAGIDATTSAKGVASFSSSYFSVSSGVVSLAASLDDLTDVDLTTVAPSATKVFLMYDGSSDWEPADSAAVGPLINIEDLDGLGSVAPVDGDIRKWDNTNSEWDAAPIYYAETTTVAATSHVINHALGQQFVNVTVYDTSSPPEQIIPDAVKLTDTNNVTVELSSSINISVVVMGLGTRAA